MLPVQKLKQFTILIVENDLSYLQRLKQASAQLAEEWIKSKLSFVFYRDFHELKKGQPCYADMVILSAGMTLGLGATLITGVNYRAFSTIFIMSGDQKEHEGIRRVIQENELHFGGFLLRSNYSLASVYIALWGFVESVHDDEQRV